MVKAGATTNQHTMLYATVNTYLLAENISEHCKDAASTVRTSNFQCPEMYF